MGRAHVFHIYPLSVFKSQSITACIILSDTYSYPIHTMSSCDDYTDEFDPYFEPYFARIDSPESEWSQLETPAGDEADEDIGVASEVESMTVGVDLVVKPRGGSP